MKTRTLILERLIEMLDERGLSSHQYDEVRSNNYLAHLIEISRDGHRLARYDTAFLHRFSEGEMEEKLDKLKDAIVVPVERVEYEKRETNEALDHVEECLDNLRSGIMIGLRPAEATLGKRWLESQIKVVESVKEEFNNLSEAIKALRKDSE
jgi:uncharacterized protein (UPF0335 family)